MPKAAKEKKSDGRHERTERTRQCILDATRDLILEGNLQPTTTQIAKNAGVTTRTLFQHFSDAETLHLEMIAAAEASAEAVIDEPFPLAIAAPQNAVCAPCCKKVCDRISHGLAAGICLHLDRATDQWHGDTKP